MAYRRMENGVLVNLSPADALPLIAKGAVDTVKRHPGKVSTYVLGLLLGMFFTGLTITTSQLQAYEAALPEDKDMRRLSKLEHETSRAYNAYYNSKGWFSCDSTCTVKYNHYLKTKAEQDQQAADVDRRMREARGILGVFSTAAINDARDVFWGVFARGKAVAKRQTMWDAFFVGMRAMGRDEGMASYIINMLFVFLSNFFASMVLSLFVFAWQVWSICTAYNAGLLLGLLFWVAAVLAAGSFLLTIFAGVALGVGGAAAGVAYVAVNAGSARRIGGYQQGYAYERVRRD